MALVANPSADLYGSDRMMLETVRGLRQSGWQVVVAVSVQGPLVAPLEDLGAQVVTCRAPVVRKRNLSVRGLGELFADVLKGAPGMLRLLRERRPDVIYVNTLTIPLWLVLARLARVKSVLHVHEAEAEVRPLVRKLLSAPSLLATRVVFNSQTSQRVATEGRLNARAKSIVVPNGVAAPARWVPPRRVLSDPIRVLYIGRLSPRKGVDVAVRAIAELRERGIVACLDLVGAVFPGYEWFELELRELVIELGLIDRVSFLGFRDDVWSSLERADVVVVPSRADESFGNVVVEAALAARPVIVSRHSGLLEAGKNLPCVRFVTADSPGELANAVAQIRADWEASRCAAEEAQRLAAAAFSPQRYRDRMVSLISAAAGDPTSAPSLP